MTRIIEVFADITCPFTHIGLKIVRAEIAALDADIDLRVRAWPLEWVNDSMADPVAIDGKIRLITEQLAVDDFRGFAVDAWPRTTIPALNLAASAYDKDQPTGLAVSLRLRALVFEHGRDVSDPAVLSELAAEFGLPAPGSEPLDSVRNDYEDGKARGVRGSPDFFVGDDEFFCPSLDLGHDEHGTLVSSFDTDGLRQLIATAASG
ncbi:MAG: disulfide bond formation protein DsbA [Acidimicrobiales bacterium]|nr:disulfide bond formation protein DsbA [Acidimicrobiales bacterium]